MYAVVRTGGKEYRVGVGDVIRVEKLEGNVGDRVTLNDVLMVSREGDVQIGTPQVAQATVTGQIIQQAKGRKILVFKMKRRKNYRRLRGHRQAYTYIKVDGISVS